MGIEGSVVKIHYQGACGSCPSSTTGTLSYIENFLKEAVHPTCKFKPTEEDGATFACDILSLVLSCPCGIDSINFMSPKG